MKRLVSMCLLLSLVSSLPLWSSFSAALQKEELIEILSELKNLNEEQEKIIERSQKRNEELERLSKQQEKQIESLTELSESRQKTIKEQEKTIDELKSLSKEQKKSSSLTSWIKTFFIALGAFFGGFFIGNFHIIGG